MRANDSYLSLLYALQSWVVTRKYCRVIYKSAL